MKIRATIIPPTGPIETEYIEDDLDTYHDILGGYMEGVTVSIKGERCYAFVNEDGMRLELPVNPLASKLYDPSGRYPILGTMIVTGRLRDDGETASIPLWIAKKIEDMQVEPASRL